MTDRRDLSRYLRSKVKSAPVLKCDICGEVMRSTTFYKSHRESEHGERFDPKTNSASVCPGHGPGGRLHPRNGEDDSSGVCEEPSE